MSEQQTMSPEQQDISPLKMEFNNGQHVLQEGIFDQEENQQINEFQDNQQYDESEQIDNNQYQNGQNQYFQYNQHTIEEEQQEQSSRYPTYASQHHHTPIYQQYSQQISQNSPVKFRNDPRYGKVQTQLLSSTPLRNSKNGSSLQQQRILGQSKIEYIPVEKTVLVQEPVQKIEYVQKEVKQIEYVAVETVNEFIPKIIEDRYIDYIPQERIEQRIEYDIVQKRIVHNQAQHQQNGNLQNQQFSQNHINYTNNRPQTPNKSVEVQNIPNSANRTRNVQPNYMLSIPPNSSRDNRQQLSQRSNSQKQNPQQENQNNIQYKTIKKIDQQQQQFSALQQQSLLPQNTQILQPIKNTALQQSKYSFVPMSESRIAQQLLNQSQSNTQRVNLHYPVQNQIQTSRPNIQNGSRFGPVIAQHSLYPQPPQQFIQQQYIQKNPQTSIHISRAVRAHSRSAVVNRGPVMVRNMSSDNIVQQKQDLIQSQVKEEEENKTQNKNFFTNLIDSVFGGKREEKK